jgi:hypothetical protein
MVAFFFGIVQFIWGTRDGDPTRAKNGKNFMLWGLIALFVMFSVWGIITYVQQIFGVTQNTITIPTIQINTGTGGGGGNTGGQPADGTSYWRCNGQVYTSQAAYDAACPNSAGTNAGATGGGAGPCDGIASETQRNACLANQGGSSGSSACDGIASETQRNACLANQGGSTNSGSCSGRSEGSSCTTAGRPGTCTTNDEGAFGCYVTTCGAGQVVAADGTCTTVRGAE